MQTEDEEPVRIPITDVFDLHSIPPRDVRAVVEEYLVEAHRMGLRALRIIPGRGIGAQRETVRSIARPSPIRRLVIRAYRLHFAKYAADDFTGAAKYGGRWNPAGMVVAHVRWYLNAIFKLAVPDGLVENNPAAELRIPNRCKEGRTIRALSEEEVNQLLDALEPRERLIARLAIFEGLRPGEILALRWGSFDGEAMRIRERVSEGKIDTPKSGKPRESAPSDGTLSALEEWRGLAITLDANAFVFPSENPKAPISRRNIWARRFLPSLEKVGLEWATFQA
jgi:integrase